MSERIIYGIKEFFKNKLRSFLTVTGISIGIASLIAVTCIGSAGKERIMDELNKFGLNRVIIYQGSGGSNLSMDDVTALSNSLSDEAYICPQSVWKTSLSYNNRTIRTDVSGTVSKLENIEYKEMSAGRFINENDNRYGNKCIVLSNECCESLFGSNKEEFAIGKSVKLNGTSLKIIGIEKKTKPIIDAIFSPRCYIPMSVLENFNKSFPLSEISVSAVDSLKTNEVANEVKKIVYDNHGSEIRVVNISEQADNAKEILSVFELVIYAVSCVSLLVGGVGIMNTMLISIKYRTKEIGIRKAVGASDADIFFEFMLESVLYSLFGSVIGILLGIALNNVISELISIDSTIKISSVYIAVAFAVIVGMAFGVYPAYRASKLKIVDAIRSE